MPCSVYKGMLAEGGRYPLLSSHWVWVFSCPGVQTFPGNWSYFCEFGKLYEICEFGKICELQEICGFHNCCLGTDCKSIIRWWENCI